MSNESDFISGVISSLHHYLEMAGHEFIFMAKYYLQDLSPVETSDRLNGCPVSPLGGKFPRDVFPPAAGTINPS